MFDLTKGVLKALVITALLTMTAVVTCAQTTGSVTMNATVSNFVELTSGGAVTLTVSWSCPGAQMLPSTSPVAVATLVVVPKIVASLVFATGEVHVRDVGFAEWPAAAF